MIDAIAAKAPGFKPKVAVILGSGLGTFAEEVQAVATVPYGELPGFPRTTVGSHAGKLVLVISERLRSPSCRGARTTMSAAAPTR